MRRDKAGPARYWLAAAASGAFTVSVPAGLSQDHDFSMANLVADSLADPRIFEALGLG